MEHRGVEASRVLFWLYIWGDWPGANDQPAYVITNDSLFRRCNGVLVSRELLTLPLNAVPWVFTILFAADYRACFVCPFPVFSILCCFASDTFSILVYTFACVCVLSCFFLFSALPCPTLLPLSLSLFFLRAVVLFVSLFPPFASLKRYLAKTSTQYIPRFLRLTFWLCLLDLLGVSLLLMCGADGGTNDCMNFLFHRHNVDLGDAVKMEVCMVEKKAMYSLAHGFRGDFFIINLDGMMDDGEQL